MKLGIVELYCGKSGKKGFYNNQEIGLAQAMEKLGYEICIFYPQNKNNKIEEQIISPNIKVIYAPSLCIGVHSKFDWNIILDYGIDVVQLDADNQIFAPSLMKFCDTKNIKLYNYIGVAGSDTTNKIKSIIMSLLYHRSIVQLKKHKCFTKTSYVKKELEEKGINNITVTPVGLDESIIPTIVKNKDELINELELPQNKKIILFVGRMDFYKKPLDALVLIDSLPVDYYLVMIGTGVLDEKINGFINEHKLADRVLRICKLPNSQIHNYYKVVDYFVNFNENEIFGMSILEAMYQKCTVIAINAPGPNEIIDANTGFIVNNIDEMKKIILNNQKIDGNKAFERIKSKFTWKETAKIFDEWIKNNCLNTRL